MATYKARDPLYVRTMNALPIAVSLLLATSLAGCDAKSSKGTRAPKLVLECTFYDGTDHEVTIDTPMCSAGGPAECTEGPWEQTFGDWVAQVSYSDDEFEGRGVSISANPTEGQGGTSVLYQIDRETPPQNEFLGGHGFTGLHYVRHPSGGQTFQFFCTASPG
jgi:hypothetical protein